MDPHAGSKTLLLPLLLFQLQGLAQAKLFGKPGAKPSVPCIGDAEAFACSTYAKWPKKLLCPYLSMGGLKAKQVCEECGDCVHGTAGAPTPAPPSETSTTTLTSTSETSTTTHAPTPAPPPVPTPTPSSACTDDQSWSPASKPMKSCAWTEGKWRRCKRKGKDEKTGYQACPETCGDDPSWKFKYNMQVGAWSKSVYLPCTSWKLKAAYSWWPVTVAVTCKAEGLDKRTGAQACPETCCGRRLAIAV